jgi:hypothetical protein
MTRSVPTPLDTIPLHLRMVGQKGPRVAPVPRLQDEGVGHHPLPSLPPDHIAVEASPSTTEVDAVLRCACSRVWVGSTLRVQEEFIKHLQAMGKARAASVTPRPWSFASHHRRGKAPVGQRRKRQQLSSRYSNASLDCHLAVNRPHHTAPDLPPPPGLPRELRRQRAPRPGSLRNQDTFTGGRLRISQNLRSSMRSFDVKDGGKD